MGFRPFYISSFEQESGQETYFESFLIPEKAFQKLEDAICWRGRVIKRPGLKSIGRLRRGISKVTLTNQAVGATYSVADLLADAAINVRAPVVGLPETYAEIAPGTVTITVGGVTFTDPTMDGTLAGAPATNTGTINYVTGALVLNFAPPLGAATNVVVTFFYYPALPCMCLQRREDTAINDEQEIAFDTKYAYTRLGTQFIELPSATATTWTGEDWKLFWTCNYYTNPNGRIYWATNNNADGAVGQDPIRYYDGTDWTTFNPTLNGATKLQQCRILVGYKNRLIAMNTWEGAALVGSINYVNKIRWSQNGDPTILATAWDDTIVNGGSYLYAPTNEAIISATFIRDTLIVKFERSSWKLVYTGNEALPFLFQKVNTDFGAESPFSLVTFDKGIFAVGDKAITVDDSVNVTRIDRKVPDSVFNIKNGDYGTERVYGVRDFSSEVVYWTFPDSTTQGVSPVFPNKVLVYNYANDTWAKFNDSFTCYGYYQRKQDMTWADYISHQNDIWKAIDSPWNSGAEQSLFPDVVAGNQQGFVSIVTSAIAPVSANDPTLAIFAISGGPFLVQLTVINHNLQTGQFIKVFGVIGSGGTNPDVLNNDNSAIITNYIYRVVRIDKDNISLEYFSIISLTFDPLDITSHGAYTGVYWGGGVISVLNGFDIITKQFSPFYEQGSQCRLGYIDFFTSTTEAGQFSSDVYVDCNGTESITGINPALTGLPVVSTAPENAALIPYQAGQDKIWHRQFVQAVAQNFSLELSLSDAQMADKSIDASSFDFKLHAIAFYISQNARLVQ